MMIMIMNENNSEHAPQLLKVNVNSACLHTTGRTIKKSRVCTKAYSKTGML